MVAAGLDRADVVGCCWRAARTGKRASAIADLKALTRRWKTAAGRSRGPPPAPPAGPRNDVPGVTRGYRYNELIGAQGGLTALHFAARQGSAAAARALVEAGADVNLREPGRPGDAAARRASSTATSTSRRTCSSTAPNPNLLSDAGVSPLYAVLNVQWAPIAAYPQPRAHLQQSRDYLDVMKLLLDNGADPNARLRRKVWYSGYNFDQSGVDEVGATPFWRAAYAADVAAMRLLVSHGADPSIPTTKLFSRRGPEDPVAGADKSGLPPVPVGGPGVHAAACGGRRRLWPWLRRQFASRRAGRDAAGGEVPRRGAGRRRERRRLRRQHRRPSRGVARRQRDDPVSWSRRAPT